MYRHRPHVTGMQSIPAGPTIDRHHQEAWRQCHRPWAQPSPCLDRRQSSPKMGNCSSRCVVMHQRVAAAQDCLQERCAIAEPTPIPCAATTPPDIFTCACLGGARQVEPGLQNATPTASHHIQSQCCIHTHTCGWLPCAVCDGRFHIFDVPCRRTFDIRPQDSLMFNSTSWSGHHLANVTIGCCRTSSYGDTR